MITEQTDCPGLCAALAPRTALQPKALAAAGPGAGAPGPTLAVLAGALRRPWPLADALSDLHARPLPPPAAWEPGRPAAGTPCPQPRGSPPRAARAERRNREARPGAAGCLPPCLPAPSMAAIPPAAPRTDTTKAEKGVSPRCSTSGTNPCRPCTP